MSKAWGLFFVILLMILIVVWFSAFQSANQNFRIIACDVGQGDAFLAIHGSTQILTDGGPSSRVIECLSRHIPFWDRQIELVIMTHPEADHYIGLVDVFKNYKVQSFATIGLDSDALEFRVLKKALGSENSRAIFLRQGQKYRLGLIHLDIVHPSNIYLEENSILNDEPGDLFDYETQKSKNNMSLVYIMSFGQFDALLTGDIEDATSDAVANQLVGSGSRAIEYLKVPHHGSKNGLSQKLVETLKPQFAVISAGKNNRYGHPHAEVLKMLNDGKMIILTTGQLGDVVVESDGKKSWVNK